jgi:photosystem II stability/assembly factor-like uncharacterized protein
MRKSRAKSRRTTRSVRSRANGATLIPILIFAIGILGLFVFRQAWRAAPAGDTAPPKPQGTQISNPPTTESWTLAEGLPSQVMRLAFSEADATRGYASVFVNKQTQALYTTTDRGMSWHQAGTVQGPVGDIVSTDPLDPQDVVMLTVYAPAPGTYTFQRSFDGGRTWSAQSTDLLTTGEVSQTGWSDSTFLVGFQLDGPLQGSSALVAFPRGQASVHLDVNGKINGKAIPHLRLLTGRHNKIQVWGNDDSAAQNSIGIATTDFGRSWVSFPSTILGTKFMPTASTDDGGTVIAVSADSKTIAVSSDGGNTWVARPSLAGVQSSNQSVFATAQSRTIVISRSDGSYILHAGKWTMATSKQVVDVSESGSQHGARLWSYDQQGHIVWVDE